MEKHDAGKASPNVLELKGVSVQFGGVRAVNNVDLTLARGEFLGLIGPNGAGKTTLLNLISGAMPPTSGEILFNGQSIVGISPDRLCHLGISRTFQNIRLFPKMTVFENVALGLHARPNYSLADALFCTPVRSGARSRTSSAPTGYWTWSGSAPTPRSTPATYPTGCSAGWSWCAPWLPIRNCCCWTSRRRA